MENFPPRDVLYAWYRGEDMDWPPLDNIYAEGKIWEEPEIQQPPLRFKVGQRVECRIGPDPVTGWASGKIIKLWYQEPIWPLYSWAPYKVLLDNRKFFIAPGDADQIIQAKYD